MKMIEEKIYKMNVERTKDKRGIIVQIEGFEDKIVKLPFEYIYEKDRDETVISIMYKPNAKVFESIYVGTSLGSEGHLLNYVLSMETDEIKVGLMDAQGIDFNVHDIAAAEGGVLVAGDGNGVRLFYPGHHIIKLIMPKEIDRNLTGWPKRIWIEEDGIGIDYTGDISDQLCKAGQDPDKIREINKDYKRKSFLFGDK